MNLEMLIILAHHNMKFMFIYLFIHVNTMEYLEIKLKEKNELKYFNLPVPTKSSNTYILHNI